MCTPGFNVCSQTAGGGGGGEHINLVYMYKYYATMQCTTCTRIYARVMIVTIIQWPVSAVSVQAVLYIIHVASCTCVAWYTVVMEVLLALYIM